MGDRDRLERLIGIAGMLTRRGGARRMPLPLAETYSLRRSRRCLLSEEIARKSHYKLDQPAPVASIEDLVNYDAIVVGAGTRFGRLSSQMANFLDQAGGLWVRGSPHANAAD
jgi:multimeric flavodoxin WrbA